MLRLFKFIETNWGFITLFTLAVITVLSLRPLETLPSVPGTDKAHHIIAYAALMFPVAFRKPKGWIILGLFFIAYSGLIELIQPYVNRYGEWLDMAANVTGLIVGVLIAQLFSRLFRKHAE